MRPLAKYRSDRFPWTGYSQARGELAETAGLYCAYCGQPISSDNPVEHKIPKADQPSTRSFKINVPGVSEVEMDWPRGFGQERLEWPNLLTACASCNSSKSSRPGTQQALQDLADAAPDKQAFADQLGAVAKDYEAALVSNSVPGLRYDELLQIARDHWVWPDTSYLMTQGPPTPGWSREGPAGAETDRLFTFEWGENRSLAELTAAGLLLREDLILWDGRPPSDAELEALVFTGWFMVADERYLIWVEEQRGAAAAADRRRQVENVIAECGLDNFLDTDRQKRRNNNRRMPNRVTAGRIAAEALSRLRGLLERWPAKEPPDGVLSTPALGLAIRAIRATAVANGHWSLWMRIFRDGAPAAATFDGQAVRGMLDRADPVWSRFTVQTLRDVVWPILVTYPASERSPLLLPPWQLTIFPGTDPSRVYWDDLRPAVAQRREEPRIDASIVAADPLAPVVTQVLYAVEPAAAELRAAWEPLVIGEHVITTYRAWLGDAEGLPVEPQPSEIEVGETELVMRGLPKPLPDPLVVVVQALLDPAKSQAITARNLAAPEELTADFRGERLTVSWRPVGDPAVAGYRLRLRPEPPTPGGPFHADVPGRESASFTFDFGVPGDGAWRLDGRSMDAAELALAHNLGPWSSPPEAVTVDRTQPDSALLRELLANLRGATTPFVLDAEILVNFDAALLLRTLTTASSVTVVAVTEIASDFESVTLFATLRVFAVDFDGEIRFGDEGALEVRLTGNLGPQTVGALYQGGAVAALAPPDATAMVKDLGALDLEVDTRAARRTLTGAVVVGSWPIVGIDGLAPTDLEPRLSFKVDAAGAIVARPALIGSLTVPGTPALVLPVAVLLPHGVLPWRLELDPDGPPPTLEDFEQLTPFLAGGTFDLPPEVAAAAAGSTITTWTMAWPNPRPEDMIWHLELVLADLRAGEFNPWQPLPGLSGVPAVDLEQIVLQVTMGGNRQVQEAVAAAPPRARRATPARSSRPSWRCRARRTAGRCAAQPSTHGPPPSCPTCSAPGRRHCARWRGASAASGRCWPPASSCKWTSRRNDSWPSDRASSSPNGRRGPTCRTSPRRPSPSCAPCSPILSAPIPRRSSRSAAFSRSRAPTKTMPRCRWQGPCPVASISMDRPAF